MARSNLELAIVVSCLIFIGVAYFEHDVLTLHLLQSLIYVAVIVLSLRHNKWGYGIGISIALLWNAFNGFSGFVFRAGFRQWREFLSTGRLTNPVHFVAPIAWFDHVCLIVLLVWASCR